MLLITIRPVLPDEWARWREVRIRMLRDDPASFATRWEDAAAEHDETWRDWVGAATGERRILFAAETDGQWLGVVAAFVRIDPREAQLMSMAVGRRLGQRSGHRGGSDPAVGAWAAERGCETVFLFVQEANVRAHRLYERAGSTRPAHVSRRDAAAPASSWCCRPRSRAACGVSSTRNS